MHTILAKKSDCEIDYFRNFQTSVTLPLDLGQHHTAVYQSSTRFHKDHITFT